MHVDDGLAGFRIGGDREERGIVPGDRREKAGARVDCRGDRGEVILDQRFDPRRIEVAHGHHSHQVRTVPILIEPAKGLVIERFQDLHVADGKPHRIPRVLEQDRELPVADTGARTPAQAPLFDDDAALPVNLPIVEADQMGPVLEDVEALAHDGGRVGRDLEHEHGLVEARVGIQVRSEADTDGFQVIHQLLPREVPGTVERHVFHHVRQAPLVIVLKDRSRIDHQPEFRAFFRFPVHPDEIGEPVRQAA